MKTKNRKGRSLYSRRVMSPADYVEPNRQTKEKESKTDHKKIWDSLTGVDWNVWSTFSYVKQWANWVRCNSWVMLWNHLVVLPQLLNRCQLLGDKLLIQCTNPVEYGIEKCHSVRTWKDESGTSRRFSSQLTSSSLVVIDPTPNCNKSQNSWRLEIWLYMIISFKERSVRPWCRM